MIKIGDIFSYSWGYDQTNVQWFQVVGKTDKTVKVREINGLEKETGFMSGTSEPLTDCFVGEPMRKTIKIDYTGKEFFNMDYGIARIWDNKPKYVSWYA